MKLTSDQYERIAPLCLKPRGKVGLSNLQVLDAILHVAWPASTFRQPAHTLHTHEPVVEERCARPGVRATATGTDGADPGCGVRTGQHRHQGAPRWHGDVKENDPQPIDKSRGWNIRLHVVAAHARTAVACTLSPGHAHDAPQGRRLLNRLTRPAASPALLMDRAYADNATRQLVHERGFRPVVRPRRNRLAPWPCDQALYRQRNEIERLFRHLKGFRRTFSRFDKLDVVFPGFVAFALIVEFLRLRQPVPG